MGGQHLRRVDNAYLILYLPLKNYWIIKTKSHEENEQLHFSLLDHQGELTRLHLDHPEKIHDLHLFGPHRLLVLRANAQSMQIQLFPIDHHIEGDLASLFVLFLTCLWCVFFCSA